MRAQTKHIQLLERRIAGLELKDKENYQKIADLLKENYDLQNQLRDALHAAEERLKIISTLPNLDNYCDIKTFQSKVKT